MTSEDDAYDGGEDADFQRWYFGGSPPENDSWPRHAFEDALRGGSPMTVETPPAQEYSEPRMPERFAMAG